MEVGVVVVGRASELAEPGAFFAHDAAGVPILVTRDHGGVVHAMLNVCGHRGTRLVSAERGSASQFVCPLHGWTYDLCGRFSLPMAPNTPAVDAPQSRCDPRERREDTMLIALPCAVRHGFLFVVPSPRARIDLDAMLGVLDEALAPLDLAHRSIVSRSTEISTWSSVRSTVSAECATWLFPGSVVFEDGGEAIHVAVQPLSGEDVEVITTRLSRAPAPA